MTQTCEAGPTAQRAHVFVRLVDDGHPVAGLRRLSATAVRLEHSSTSPGVASISFERVFDATESNAQVFHERMADGIAQVASGQRVSLLTAGTAHSGKSSVMHGSNGKETGLIRLAIERLYEELERVVEVEERIEHDEYIAIYGAPASGSIVHLPSGERIAEADVLASLNDPLLGAQRMESKSAMVEFYAHAWDDVENTEQNWVVVISVRLRHCNGDVLFGQLVCIDMHGNQIVEPVVDVEANAWRQRVVKRPHFVDTHFPVQEVLTKCFGQCLGNHWMTFIVVPIKTSVEHHQQAIQSLLFACKAKEIQFMKRCNRIQSAKVKTAVKGGSHAFKQLWSSKDDETRSTDLLRNSADGLLYEIPNAPSLYSLDKALGSFGLNVDEGAEIEERLDCLVEHARKLEQSLESESSIKEKCVERISKLTQSMSFQVVEHEKQLAFERKAKEDALQRLAKAEAKHFQVLETIQQLENEVTKLKEQRRPSLSQGKRHPALIDSHVMNTDRDLLHSFAQRLEIAMEEAKGVVEMKNDEIDRLKAEISALSFEKQTIASQLKEKEEKLQDEIKVHQDQIDELLAKQKKQTQLMNAEAASFQRQKNELTQTVQELQLKMNQLECDFQSRLEIAQGQSELKYKSRVDEVLTELATTRKELEKAIHQRQWLNVMHEATRKILDKRIHELESELEQLSMQREKDRRKAEKRIKLLLRERNKEQSELHVQHHMLEEELQVLKEREKATEATCAKLQEENDRLRNQNVDLTRQRDSLQDQVAKHAEALRENEMQCQQQCQQLATARDEERERSETRLRELENRLVQSSIHKEAVIAKEYDEKIRMLRERHHEEICTLERELAAARSLPMRSNENQWDNNLVDVLRSSTASSSMASCSHEQKSLDDLFPTSRHTQEAYSTLSSCPPRPEQDSDGTEIGKLRLRVQELVRALAHSNEEESLVKDQARDSQAHFEQERNELLTQLNKLKQENWQLNLALQVTEKTQKQKESLLPLPHSRARVFDQNEHT